MIPETLHGPSITLDSVSLKEGKQILLDNISCEFSAGQWHGIVGPNGGGKSTLLKTILGLKPHKGTVQLIWSSSVNPGMNARSQTGYIPQLMPFDPSLPISVRDYVLMFLSRKPLVFSRRLPARVLAALEQVGLQKKLERKLGDLSGGERQRLMLCCALLNEPSLLILDEPMTGLDKEGQTEVVGLLERYRKAGGTIVMVEHDWQLVNDCCDRVYLIDKGLKQTGEKGCLSSSGIQPQPRPVALVADESSAAAVGR